MGRKHSCLDGGWVLDPSTTSEQVHPLVNSHRVAVAAHVSFGHAVPGHVLTKSNLEVVPMTRRRILSGVSILVISLFWMIQAPAQSLVKGALTAKTSEAVNRHDQLQTTRASLVAARTGSLSVRVRTRLRTLVVKGCGCTLAPQDGDDAFGNCWQRCLNRSGISTTTVIACGGVCVSAGTGNPVALGLCAACLGTGEWIVAGCAMYCVWTRSDNLTDKGMILTKNLSDRRRPQGIPKVKTSAPRV